MAKQQFLLEDHQWDGAIVFLKKDDQIMAARSDAKNLPDDAVPCFHEARQKMSNLLQGRHSNQQEVLESRYSDRSIASVDRLHHALMTKLRDDVENGNLQNPKAGNNIPKSKLLRDNGLIPSTLSNQEKKHALKLLRAGGASKGEAKNWLKDNVVDRQAYENLSALSTLKNDEGRAMFYATVDSLKTYAKEKATQNRPQVQPQAKPQQGKPMQAAKSASVNRQQSQSLPQDQHQDAIKLLRKRGKVNQEEAANWINAGLITSDVFAQLKSCAKNKNRLSVMVDQIRTQYQVTKKKVDPVNEKESKNVVENEKVHRENQLQMQLLEEQERVNRQQQLNQRMPVNINDAAQDDTD